MYDVRAYTCPSCKAANAVLARVVTHNDEAGAETWATCWSCSGDFHLTAQARRAGGSEHLAAATRSPLGWNLAFPMWHRRLR